MKNTRFRAGRFRRITRDRQAEQLQNLIRQELTELQHDTLIAYYVEGKTLPEIAGERNVNKSTVSRTLKRAEEKLARFLQYGM